MGRFYEERRQRIFTKDVLKNSATSCAYAAVRSPRLLRHLPRSLKDCDETRESPGIRYFCLRQLGRIEIQVFHIIISLGLTFIGMGLVMFSLVLALFEENV
jgi:hypothetical protein